MPSALIVLVYALAVARITRLIVADRITEAPRERLADRLWARDWWRVNERQLRERWPDVPTTRLKMQATIDARAARADGAEPPLLPYLLSCPWCASIYVGAVAAPIVYWWGSNPWFLVPALALAFSHATGLLAKIGES